MKINYGTIIIALVLFAVSSVGSGPAPIIPVILLLVGTFGLWKKSSKLLVAILLLLVYYALLISVPIDWIVFHQYSYLELIIGPIVHIFFIYVLFEEIKRLCIEDYLVRRWTEARSFVYSFTAFYLFLKPFTLLFTMPNSFYLFTALIIIKLIIIGKLITFIRNVVIDTYVQA